MYFCFTFVRFFYKVYSFAPAQAKPCPLGVCKKGSQRPPTPCCGPSLPFPQCPSHHEARSMQLFYLSFVLFPYALQAQSHIGLAISHRESWDVYCGK